MGFIGEVNYDLKDSLNTKEGRKEMFYLTTHSTHFILRLYGVGLNTKELTVLLDIDFKRKPSQSDLFNSKIKYYLIICKLICP